VHNKRSASFLRVSPVLSCLLFASFVGGCGGFEDLTPVSSRQSISVGAAADTKSSKPWLDVPTSASSVTSPAVQAETVALASELSPTSPAAQTDVQTVSAVVSKSLTATDQNLAARAGSISSGTVPNTLAVSSATGKPVSNVPLQLGRVFRKGEVMGCPRTSINGTNIEAQFDVKNRYDDGSLKFASISVMLPRVDNQTATLAFDQDEACSAKTDFNISQQLSQFPSFDLSVRINSNDSNRASVRAMLAAGKFSVLENGPIATTLLVADHTTKSFDFGVDGFKSLRPIFHVKFWKRTNLVTVRVIVEQSDTQKMQAQTYSVEISGGLTTNDLLYSKATVNHHFASRWTKEFSLGTPAAALNIKHNIAYLASTKALPNFDSRVTLANSSKDAMLNNWSNVSAENKDIFGAGMYQKYMPGAGGRPEIGILTDWTTYALFDGDARLWSMLKKNADLAAAWPVHFREGDGSRNAMNLPSKKPGLGLPITRDGRKLMFLYDNNGYLGRFAQSAVDEPIFVGAKNHNDWVAECGHQPDDNYPLYLVTGDPWYLEQLQFWASWGLFGSNPLVSFPGRVIEDAELDNQLRGEAWCLRTRARAAFASIDGTTEKVYFDRVTNSAIRAFEGMKLGPGADPVRTRWAANFYTGGNPLNAWKWQPVNVKPDTSNATQTWTHAFMVMALGHIGELGFDTKELLTFSSKLLITIGTTPGVNPDHLSDYQIPITRNVNGNPFFASWAEAFKDWSSWQSEWKNFQTDLVHGYPNIINAASSFIAKEPGGGALWDHMYLNNYSTRPWDQNPKWAVLPR
jgi:hypothetical protein